MFEECILATFQISQLAANDLVEFDNICSVKTFVNL